MSVLIPSPPQDASSTVRGLVGLVAQTWAGAKTFLGLVIASAGVQVASLFNTNGTGASDVVVKLGTSVADGSVNGAAKLLSLRTGLNGGTEVEKAFIDKGFGLYVGQGLEVGGGSGTAYRDANVVLTFNSSSKSWLFNGYNGGGHVMSLSRLGRFALNGAIAVASTGVAPATAVFRSAGVLNETVLRAEQRSTHTEPIQEWVKNSDTTPAIVAKVEPDGTFENLTNGAGLVLRSPDGTRWRITVTNAGALNVAAA